jgi:hypothetical protein
LLLGDKNTVVVGDKTYDLKTPSAQQSKLKINQTLVVATYEFMLMKKNSVVVQAGNSIIFTR